jgi:hypothetical protein
MRRVSIVAGLLLVALSGAGCCNCGNCGGGFFSNHSCQWGCEGKYYTDYFEKVDHDDPCDQCGRYIGRGSDTLPIGPGSSLIPLPDGRYATGNGQPVMVSEGTPSGQPAMTQTPQEQSQAPQPKSGHRRKRPQAQPVSLPQGQPVSMPQVPPQSR